MNSTASEQGLPLGISDFAKLRVGNKVYVDKTAMVYRLARCTSCAFGSAAVEPRPVFC
jgi:hypothetical protein